MKQKTLKLLDRTILDTLNSGASPKQVSRIICRLVATMAAFQDELLDALQDCLTIVQDEYNEDPEPDDLTSWKRAIDKANAAIAKATPEPPFDPEYESTTRTF